MHEAGCSTNGRRTGGHHPLRRLKRMLRSRHHPRTLHTVSVGRELDLRSHARTLLSCALFNMWSRLDHDCAATSLNIQGSSPYTFPSETREEAASALEDATFAKEVMQRLDSVEACDMQSKITLDGTKSDTHSSSVAVVPAGTPLASETAATHVKSLILVPTGVKIMSSTRWHFQPTCQHYGNTGHGSVYWCTSCVVSPCLKPSLR